MGRSPIYYRSGVRDIGRRARAARHRRPRRVARRRAGSAAEHLLRQPSQPRRFRADLDRSTVAPAAPGASSRRCGLLAQRRRTEILRSTRVSGRAHRSRHPYARRRSDCDDGSGARSGRLAHHLSRGHAQCERRAVVAVQERLVSPRERPAPRGPGARVDREPQSRHAQRRGHPDPAVVHRHARRSHSAPGGRRQRGVPPSQPRRASCPCPPARERRMNAPRPCALLFASVVAVLMVASCVGYGLHRRFAAAGPNPAIDNLNARIKAWWVMVVLLGIAFAFGKTGVIVLFALASLAALREFITLTPTRRGDHIALAVAFFVVLPAQYYLVWIDWYGLYSVFIPVYVFLLLATIAALRQDTKHFMRRVAETQWGLMLSVFSLSHVPALLGLKIPGYEGRSLLLIAFLILVVQSSDVLQYIWGKLLGRHKIAPELSPSKTVEGFVGGVGTATLLGSLLWWIT